MLFSFRSLLLLFSVFLWSLALRADRFIPVNTQAPGEEPPSPEEAAALISVPEGFSVTLFAGEPEVRQPIAMQIDDRGRLWVAESYSYKEWEFKGQDRILIFEDGDNDGRFDKRTIFWDKGTHLSGFAIGYGGVWICNSPRLEFIPDRDGDDVPDGALETILDGFSVDAKHNFFNGLTWGLDGWLYGRHGITAPSLVGVPGTPNAERIDVDCGIWRIDPVTHTFEMVLRGTTNPWGLDWNDVGEMFFTGNVNGHLWHGIPGARYPRMHGQGFSFHVYDRIGLTADHLHHEGEWTDRRKFRDNAEGLTNELGGGHSHAGGMIYLGDNWPDEYRNTIFMSNTHGRRINNDILERQGSGYVGRHGRDFLISNQPWYKGVTQIYGPDGGVFMSDWTDLGECHDNDGVHRTSGRIYKVVYGEAEKGGGLNLKEESNRALANYQLHRNEWFARHSRRILNERFVGGVDVSDSRPILEAIVDERKVTVAEQLRALWTLHSVGGVGESRLTDLLDHANEHVRSWAIRLIGEGGNASVSQFQKIRLMAEDGKSLLVRLYIASTLPRFAQEQQWRLAESLVKAFGYESDQNLPQMIWYALEPLVASDPMRALEWLDRCRDPMVYRSISRRIASEFESNDRYISELVTAFDRASRRGDERYAKAGLEGLEAAFNGLKGITAPKNWSLIANSRLAEIRLFGERFDSIFGNNLEMSSNDWIQLLQEPTLRRQAIRELAAFDDFKVGALLIKDYRRYGLEDRQAVISTLSSRKSLATVLLQAMQSGNVKRSEVSAYHARQIFGLGDEKLGRQLESVWGTIGHTPAEKRTEIEHWQSRLTPRILASADTLNGNEIFDRSCVACHRLYGKGGSVGPDLSGADRQNLYYLIENLVDPSAVLPRDFRMTLVSLKDGRVLAGTISAQSPHSITLVGLEGEHVIANNDILKKEQVEQSIMPEGLLQNLTENEVRDLVGFLQSK
ncbi:MAG: c-type cytochrome [Opitutales bacterium]|nr:c-type cytochrome [Opitutales bacterium]